MEKTTEIIKLEKIVSLKKLIRKTENKRIRASFKVEAFGGEVAKLEQELWALLPDRPPPPPESWCVKLKHAIVGY